MNNTPKNTDFSCNFYCREHVWVPPRVKYALYGNALMWKCIFSSLWVLCSRTDCSQIASLIPTPKRSELVTAVYNSSSNITDRIVQRLCHEKSILKGLSGYPCGLWTFWDLTYFSLCFGGFCSFYCKKPTFYSLPTSSPLRLSQQLSTTTLWLQSDSQTLNMDLMGCKVSSGLFLTPLADDGGPAFCLWSWCCPPVTLAWRPNHGSDAMPPADSLGRHFSWLQKCVV